MSPGYVIWSPNETDEELYDYLPELVTRDDILAPHSYELMLRSIGMSWTQDEPLPKPQVLYEDDN